MEWQVIEGALSTAFHSISYYHFLMLSISYHLILSTLIFSINKHRHKDTERKMILHISFLYHEVFLHDLQHFHQFYTQKIYPYSSTHHIPTSTNVDKNDQRNTYVIHDNQMCTYVRTYIWRTSLLAAV